MNGVASSYHRTGPNTAAIACYFLSKYIDKLSIQLHFKYTDRGKSPGTVVYICTYILKQICSVSQNQSWLIFDTYSYLIIIIKVHTDKYTYVLCQFCGPQKDRYSVSAYND